MTKESTRTNILWTGQNPLILLKPSKEENESTAIGLWKIHISPAGTGCAAFIISELADKNTYVACLTDNENLAVWLQKNIVNTLPEFQSKDFSKLPIIQARFTSLGDTRRNWTELINYDQGEIRLTWSELMKPFNLFLPKGSTTIPYELNTILLPAKKAIVEINGQIATGEVYPDEYLGQPHSTAFLAFSEVWYT